MQVQYINLFNQAKQYRTANPIVSGIVLLLILVLIPVVIAVAIVGFFVLIIYAKVKTFVRSLMRNDGGQPRIKVTRNSKPAEPEYAQYEIIEETTVQK